MVSPIRRDPLAGIPVSKSKETVKTTPVKKTAEKVSEVVQLPVPMIGQKRGREVQLLDDASSLVKKIQRSWDEWTPPELAEQIIELEDRVAQLNGSSPEIEKVKRATEHLHFEFVFPVALELDANPSHHLFSFAKEIHRLAKEVFATESLIPFQHLNPVQQYEVLRYAGKGGHMSPEVIAHTMKEYVHGLQHQAAVAEAFFFGRLAEGMEGLLKLPEDVRTKIDQLIWDASGGAAIDPTEKESQSLIAAAIMHSVEERMGMLEV